MKTIKSRKVVYLDMDGTIANLYGVSDWLPKLEKEEQGLFLNLEPLVTEEELLNTFPKDEYEIRILSMTPNAASQEYCEIVKREKDLWLNTFFPNSISKRIYKKYGKSKNLRNCVNTILVDDNKTIRMLWKGKALCPTELWG